jgi:hypothetical protein
MAELSTVLQLLEEIGKGIAEVVDSVNKAQAYYQRVSKGTGNNLLASASRHCQHAPGRFKDGMKEIRAAQVMVGKHLVTVATKGRK